MNTDENKKHTKIFADLLKEKNFYNMPKPALPRNIADAVLTNNSEKFTIVKKRKDTETSKENVSGKLIRSPFSNPNLLSDLTLDEKNEFQRSASACVPSSTTENSKEPTSPKIVAETPISPTSPLLTFTTFSPGVSGTPTPTNPTTPKFTK